ncbi:MAG: glycosyltransferase family 2 protein [Candidatus Bathyarchaeota archaeon]|uniref:glycosyltransferase family 2 protein n=1 Tax=Candidatus Bathycorpusculum sp. TaxID=2994959 RepID=UPI0028288681|nr:glycosyltransferase family 2 protein [Candidatus Termiticorpusculum sp.]MCL2292399.1 glycosyltransferase family 2 protein [Candidatus Termiticorpusculum sp.]
MMFNRKFLLWINVIFTVAVILGMYVYRGNWLIFYGSFTVLTIFSLSALCLCIFRFVGAYKYRSIRDVGERPFVYVIVSAFNEAKMIGKTIDAILHSDYPQDKLQLIVADDGSTDDTCAVIKAKNVEYGDRFKVHYNVKNMGKRYTVATVVKLFCTVKDAVLVLVDSDACVAVDAVRMIVQPFVDSDVYSVCGNAVVSNSDKFVTKFQRCWYAGAFRVRKASESLIGMVMCCSGVFSAYRLDKVLLVLDDWVNETFFGKPVVAGDDSRLTNLASLKLGGKSVFQEFAYVYAVVPNTFGRFVRQQMRWGRNSLRRFVFAASFFWRRSWAQKLVFYCTMFVTLVSPFAVVGSLVVLVLRGSFMGVVVCFACLWLFSVLYAMTDKLLVSYFSWEEFLFRCWFFVVMVMISFVYLYAYLTPWKGTVWGTR